MSVVVNVIFNGKSFLMCDGRSKDNTSGEIKNESQLKIEKLSKTIAIGYTGKLEHAEHLKNNLIRLAKVNHISYADDAFELAKFIIQETLKKCPSFNACLLITGITSDKSLSSFTISSPSLKSSIITQSSGIAHVVIGENAYNFERFVIENKKLLQDLSDEAILNIMHSYISHVSKLVDTVNDNIFSITTPYQIV